MKGTCIVRLGLSFPGRLTVSYTHPSYGMVCPFAAYRSRLSPGSSRSSSGLMGWFGMKVSLHDLLMMLTWEHVWNSTITVQYSHVTFQQALFPNRWCSVTFMFRDKCLLKSIPTLLLRIRFSRFHVVLTDWSCRAVLGSPSVDPDSCFPVAFAVFRQPTARCPRSPQIWSSGCSSLHFAMNSLCIYASNLSIWDETDHLCLCLKVLPRSGGIVAKPAPEHWVFVSFDSPSCVQYCLHHPHECYVHGMLSAWIHSLTFANVHFHHWSFLLCGWQFPHQ